MEIEPRKALSASLIHRAGIASVDQAILSATSFVISILLIRTVTKEEYGYYAVAIPIYLFLESLQNAVVNTPLAVLLPSKRGDVRRNYVSSLGYGQFLVIVPAACLGLLAAALLCLGGMDPIRGTIAGALSAASIGLLYREFIRSYLFAEQEPAEVLKMDILYVAILLGLLAISHRVFRISVDMIFLFMGGSALLVALFFSRGRGWRFIPRHISTGYRENWKLGKWALIGVCVTHAQNYSYLYLLGILSGSVAVADVSAARLLLMPMLLVQAGWGKIAIPHGSKLREEGRFHRFVKELIVTSLVFLFVVAAYVVVVLVFSGTLKELLLSEKYAESFVHVIPWGTIFIAGFIAMNGSYGLQVMMEFRIITVISFFVMIVTVGSAYFLIRGYGISGGLAALLFGQVLLAAGLWIPLGKIMLSQKGLENTVSVKKDAKFEFSDSSP